MRALGLLLRVAMLACVAFCLPGPRVSAGSASVEISTWLSGWPMVGHDPQRTSASADIGPTTLRLVFGRRDVGAQPLVGSDGNVYVWSGRGLMALGPGGHRRWLYAGSEGDAGGPPVLTPTGTVEVAGYPAHTPRPDPRYARIMAISPAGRLSWMLRPKLFAKGAAPLLTEASTLYAPFVGPVSGQLDIIAPGGRIIRHLPLGSFYSIAQAQDGTLYAFVKDAGLVALDSQGAIRWQRELGISDAVNLPILVGQTGTVYVATARGVATYDSRGSLLWEETETGRALALAQSADGSLLVADSHALTRLDEKGRPVWRVPMATSSPGLPPALVVDGRGTSYVLDDANVLRIVSADGAVMTERRLSSQLGYTAPALALGPHKRLATIARDGFLRLYGDWRRHPDRRDSP